MKYVLEKGFSLVKEEVFIKDDGHIKEDSYLDDNYLPVEEITYIEIKEEVIIESNDEDVPSTSRGKYMNRFY